MRRGVSNLGSVFTLLAILVGLAGFVSFYLTYRPSGPREWTAAAADFGALAFTDPWIAAVAATAAGLTVLAAVLKRPRRSERDPRFHPLPETQRRRRLAGRLWIAAGLSWLVLAIAVFRIPLTVALRPFAAKARLDRTLLPPAPGVVLQVLSDPPGGRLSVNGVGRGTTPMLANVICRQGRSIRLRIEKEGFPTWEGEVDCREGGTILVEARLGS